MTLGGLDFTGVVTVSFGGNAASVVTSTAASVTVLAPAGTGLVLVVLTDQGGLQSNALPYTYVPATPTVTPTATMSPTWSPSSSPSQTPPPTQTFTVSPTRTPGTASLGGTLLGGSGTYVFVGTGSPGDVVVITDTAGTPGLPSGVVGPGGTFSLTFMGTLPAGDLVTVHSGGAGGPASGGLTVQAPPLGTPAPSPAVPLAVGAGAVTVNGVAGEPALIVDPSTGQVLGSGTIPAGGTGVVFINPPLAAGQSVELLVGGQLQWQAGSSAPAVAAPQLVSGTVLTDGSVIYVDGTPGSTLQVVDAQGRILGSALAGTGATPITVAGGSAGQTLYLVSDGVKTPLAVVAMAMGGQHAILSANLYRPGRGSLVVTLKPAFDEHLTVKVFNLAGELVEDLGDVDAQAGLVRTLQWWGQNRYGEGVANGVYFVSVHGPKTHELKKVVVVK